MSKLAYYRHVYYTLALMLLFAKNRVICSLIDIRENVQWPRFLAHPVCCTQFGQYKNTAIDVVYSQLHLEKWDGGVQNAGYGIGGGVAEGRSMLQSYYPGPLFRFYFFAVKSLTC